VPKRDIQKTEEGQEKGEEFESKLLDLSRVAHTRAGGKKLRFRALVITGNKAGKVGVGVASGLDVAQAIEKATYQSKKNMIKIPIVEETIPHEVYAKFGAAEILLKPQRKGRGLVAGGTVRVICRLAGIKNISSKILGRTGNKINNARATIKALKELKVRSE
jgi:small subunit ribosomal protein S5